MRVRVRISLGLDLHVTLHGKIKLLSTWREVVVQQQDMDERM